MIPIKGIWNILNEMTYKLKKEQTKENCNKNIYIYIPVSQWSVSDQSPYFLLILTIIVPPRLNKPVYV